jgi:hypothetical protein
VAGGSQPVAPSAETEPEGEGGTGSAGDTGGWSPGPRNGGTRPRGSFDPNEIIGPAGFSPNGFLAGVQTLPYTIRFENDPDLATAPAQEVTITHELDVDLDLATFELGDFGFGSLIIDTPAGLQSYQTRVDYQNQDGSPLLVDVSAELDAETGVVVWAFRSVDPATGELPEGVFDGFLPLNDGTGRGEGFVNFSVRPQADADTGTGVDAAASIVFDVNAPILTNTHVNTIDQEAPESMVDPLPGSTVDPDITVTWSSDDGAGSGVAFYDVYVSIDGGPFEVWQDDTTAETAVYHGEVGHTYAFYSVATDNVGWVEEAPATADTQIAVESATWHNADRAEDVDGLGGVDLQDLIAVVTFLRNNGVVEDLPTPSDGFQPPPYVDVNNDDQADLQDLIRVVLFLRAQIGGGGEGETVEISVESRPSNDVGLLLSKPGDEDDEQWSAVLLQIAEDIANGRK